MGIWRCSTRFMACSENESECSSAAAASASRNAVPPEGGAPEVGWPGRLEPGVRLGSRMRPPLWTVRSGPIRSIVAITSFRSGCPLRGHDGDCIGLDELAANLENQAGVGRLSDRGDDAAHRSAVDVDAFDVLADKG